MEWHGQRAMDIARMALVSAELRAPVCPHTSHIVAEVVEAYRRECAITLGDVLLRRVPVALGACWSESCSREAALRIGAVMGWDDSRSGREPGVIRNGARRLPAPPLPRLLGTANRRRLTSHPPPPHAAFLVEG